MILYVNGDSHTAGAEAVNQHAFAEDDPHLCHLGRLPHPENLVVTWGKQLSIALRAGFQCGAESAASNARIIRTTREWVKHNPSKENLIVIQWSTWEREEWLIDKIWYQVNGSGIDIVPEEYQQKYKEYVVSLNWEEKTQEAHQEIWKLHKDLETLGIKHIFFNGNNSFERIQNRFDWGTSYIGPYDPAQTFDSIIKASGIDTVSPNSWHFGKDGHSFFNRFLLQYIINNKII